METNTSYTANKRIDWIDVAKGLGIILVIFAHTIGRGLPESICKGCIYTFHMPLFFILSALTLKLSADGGQLMTKAEKGFKRLIIPALLIYAFITVIRIPRQDSVNWIGFAAEKINALLYASASPIHVQNAKVAGVGMLWFFFSLFAGRILFDFLHLKLKEEKLLTAATAAMAVFGFFIGRIQALPFSFDITLVCLPFFYFGYYLKDCRIDDSLRKTTVIALLLWMASAALSCFLANDVKRFYIDLATRRYPLFPLFYVSAMSGALFFCNCCKYLTDRFPGPLKPLLFIGKNSLCLFCIHAIDSLYKPLYRLTDYNFCNFLIRISLDLLLLVILTRLIELIKNRKKQKSPDK